MNWGGISIEKVTLFKRVWGCKSYNPECKQGTCSIYSYQKKKVIVTHNTG